ncbi:MAG: hypothetical protein ABI273_01485 [Lacunisphaera sp.]
MQKFGEQFRFVAHEASAGRHHPDLADGTPRQASSQMPTPQTTGLDSKGELYGHCDGTALNQVQLVNIPATTTSLRPNHGTSYDQIAGGNSYTSV